MVLLMNINDFAINHEPVPDEPHTQPLKVNHHNLSLASIQLVQRVVTATLSTRAIQIIYRPFFLRNQRIHRRTGYGRPDTHPNLPIIRIKEHTIIVIKQTNPSRNPRTRGTQHCGKES